jgi:SAM-dependent methyltransferase
MDSPAAPARLWPVDQPDATGRSTDGSRAPKEWFRIAFDAFYSQLYAHRDQAEAVLLIRTLRDRFDLGGPVLDLACGAGRFLRALREAGLAAVGLDLSPPLLLQARSDPENPSSLLIRADMRRLPLPGRSFPWALLMFTSFGYFDHEADDRAVVTELARVLRSRGRLALDFLNVGHVIRELVPESCREVSGREVRESRWIDPTGPFLRKRVSVSSCAATTPQAVYDERVRLYSPSELAAHLTGAGFAVEAILGDYAGNRFEEGSSPRCILIGRKES